MFMLYRIGNEFVKPNYIFSHKYETDNDDDDNINLYSAMWHVQMSFTVSIHEIKPKASKAPLAATIRFMYDL